MLVAFFRTWPWLRQHARAAVIVAAPALCAGLALPIVASAEPWAAPGDVMLRYDIEFLADSGAINIPVTTWPMSWGNIAKALNSVPAEQLDNPAIASVVSRLEERVAVETAWGSIRGEYRVSASETQRPIRSFENTPRGNGEASVAFGYTGMRFATRLEMTAVAEGGDDQSFRFDGSYAGFALGNTMVSVGLQDKWWGPGWESTLGLSTSARPVAGVMLQRNVTDPAEIKWLRWIGPWRASVFMGNLEGDRAVPDPYLFGARFAFRPIKSLEIGLSRTAQWGGEGRPETFDSFLDMLFGRDNAGEVDRDEEPGNQLAGYDWRWTALRGSRPLVFYGQLMGEDEAGGLPSRFLGQLGLSTTGRWGDAGAGYRLYLEFSDTTCQFHESSRIYNCAYASSLYPDGYRYRQRPIGHSTDADSRQVAFGGTFIDSRSRRYTASLRVAELNRGGSPEPENFLTPVKQDYVALDTSHERDFLDGVLSVGLGFQSLETPSENTSSEDVLAFINWRSHR
ncbi:MAG: capsule assembly Wzi family protein [Pseudomonadota bacterium]